MLFFIDESVFKSPSNFDRITAFIICINDSKVHDFYFGFDVDKSTSYTDWFDGTTQGIKKIMLDLIINSNKGLAAKLHRFIFVCDDVSVKKPIKSLDVICVTDLLHRLHEPFSFFLENGVADRDFLKVFLHDDFDLNLDDLEACKAIKFVSCGGIDEIPKHIDKNRKSHCASGTINYYSFVLCDSDLIYKTSIDRDPKVARVVKICQREKIEHYVLKRRNIENYLPKNAVDSYIKNRIDERIVDPDKDKYAQVLWSLPEEIRFFINLKEGLSKDIGRFGESGLIDSGKAYNTLGVEVKRILNYGGGEKMSQLFDSQNWNYHSLCLQDFLESDVMAELRPITQKIMRLL